jgi:hypothetical protein
MKKFDTLTSLVFLAMAVPAVSLAQPAPDQAAPPAQVTVAPAQQMSGPAQPMSASAAPTSGVNAATGPIPADQLPPGQANALAAGDNQLVANKPVPDTPANRAKFGGPKSHGGKKTKPIGN